MNATLGEQACSLFFYVIAPGLLIVRFFWPRLMPRWGLLVWAAVLGGAAFYLREFLHQAELMEVGRRLGFVYDEAPFALDGMVRLQSPRAVDFVVGAILELVYLLLWLVPYGITQILLARRRSPIQVLIEPFPETPK